VSDALDQRVHRLHRFSSVIGRQVVRGDTVFGTHTFPFCSMWLPLNTGRSPASNRASGGTGAPLAATFVLPEVYGYVEQERAPAAEAA
jgi:hypothetical protein